MPRTSALPLADHALGGKLKERLEGYLEAGLSHDQMALELSALLPSSISRETVRRWLKALGLHVPRKTKAAAA